MPDTFLDKPSDFVGYTLTVPKADVSFFKTMAKKMGWTVERKKARTKFKSASVLMINSQGIMLSVLGRDYFLSYNRIPWMQDAPIRSVLNVQMSGPEAIVWPDLDVDLEIDSLRHPERYPLVIKRNALDFIAQ